MRGLRRKSWRLHPSHGERLASFPGEPARLVVFPHGDCNTIFGANQERYLEEVAALIALCSAAGQ